MTPLRAKFLTRSKSWTRPDVRIRVRTDVIQVQGEHASIGCVVPIAATDGHVVVTHTPIYCCQQML